MSKSEDLVEELMAENATRDPGVVINDLLREFHQGLDLEQLRALLRSERLQLVKAGIWIASELGRRAQPVLKDVDKLLDHGEPYVRYHAIDSVLSSADEGQGPVIARVILALNDSSQAVRIKVIEFLARATDNQLRAAVAGLESTREANPELADRLAWLLAKPSEDETSGALRSTSGTVQAFGVAAALRYRMLEGEILTVAENSAEPAIREVVKSEVAARRRQQERKSATDRS